MTNTEEDIDMELRSTKYPNFRVATGGKGPPEEPSEDWLSAYEVGTTFVSIKRNNRDGDFELFHLLFKLPDVVLLKWELCDGKLLDKYVAPAVFSRVFKPGVILGVAKLETSKEDTNDVRRSRQRNPRGSSDVVLHEAVQRTDPVAPEEE